MVKRRSADPLRGKHWSRAISDNAWRCVERAFDIIDDMDKDALATYLDTLARDDCFRVETVLKKAAHEVTEVVYFIGNSGGEIGPFIRKRISGEAGIGSAYATIFAVQKLGKRFKHLPRIYDVHERDDELIVIMEYVSGHTLHDEVYENNATISLAEKIFPQLCDGVTELHEGFNPPIIHRDLKPSNAIIGNGNLTIIDFGIARSFRADVYADTTPFGTRAYAPPEQFGYGQTDQRSDTYALGMILCYLLTEENPTSEDISRGFPKLAQYPPLQEVIVRATAFDPATRFQSAADMKASFLKAVASIPAKTTHSQQAIVPSQDRQASDAEQCFPYPQAPQATQSIHSIQMPQQAHPLQREGVKATEVLGIIWNVIVAGVWAVFIFASFVAVFSPVESTAIYPEWFRVIMFPCMFGSFVSALAYALIDKRWLRRRIPFMANQTYGRSLLVSAALLGVSIFLLIVLVVIITATDSFA